MGRIGGKIREKGRKLPTLDSLIAATTKYHNCTLVTRNAKDFEGIDILVINPFENLR